MISTDVTVLCRPVNVPPPSPTPAGWFPDPLGRHDHRYFNGRTWTADVSTDGRRYVDPLGTGPGGPAGQTAGPVAARNGLATAALVCGIIGMVVAWVPFLVIVGLVLAVLAIVLGIRGVRRSSTLGAGRGAAITGIVTGGIGVALSVVGVALSIIVYQAVDAFIDPGPVIADVTSCTIDGSNAIIDGEVTNRSRSERDYSVFVTVDDRTTAISIDDVEAGDTVSWSATLAAPGDGECVAVVDVQGPFPFGIEIDPVDS
jgi:hypothetical protein